jgi:hypothetical protein
MHKEQEINYIPLIQEMLKEAGLHDLAVKLEGAAHAFEAYEEYDGIENGTLYIYVRHDVFPHFIDFQDTSQLIVFFEGLYTHRCITRIEFKVNTEKYSGFSVNDLVYIFVDEAGDMDFSAKGSRYYMFHFLVKQRPFHLHEHIANYRYSLLERNLQKDNFKRLDIEAFHANEDNRYIKKRMFEIIGTFNEDEIKVYSYILEKPKVLPDKRHEKDKFYIENLNFAIKRLLKLLSIDKNFIIMTDRLPVKQNKKRQIAALKKGIKEYIRHKRLSIRYDIFHHCSASSANLQVIDYIGWAIFRKYEHNDDSFFKNIEKYIIKIDEMTKNRKNEFYEKK